MTPRSAGARRLAAGLGLTVLVAGCGTVDWSRPWTGGPDWRGDRADDGSRSGRCGGPAGAGRDAAQARALHAVSLQLDPSRGRPDYRAAHAALERLLAGGSLEGEWRRAAEAWRAALERLLAQEELVGRMEGEARRLQGQLSARGAQSARLRAEIAARDAEAARLREEAATLRAALDRLKQIDLDVEARPEPGGADRYRSLTR
jgi:hypothetical protein